ncbi:MAG: ATP-binding protein [Candidatus Woesearchaeota archaeon]
MVKSGVGTSIKGQIKGQIISGKFGEIVARQKSDVEFELGEILVSDDNTSDNSNYKIFLQVYDLQYGSQISQQNLELISGMNLEENADLVFMDKNLRNYKIAFLKNMISVSKDDQKIVTMSKSLPGMFSTVRTVTRDDLSFITRPMNPLFFGNLRSGSKTLDVPIYLDGIQVLTHHILICGTTGKGKSVLMSNILWDGTGKDYNGLLVLDPHNEYFFGDGRIGLKDHPSGNVSYYSVKNNVPGSRSLKINIKVLKPSHFGCLDFSDAQEQAMNAYYRDYGIRWIESVLLEKPIKVNFNDATINVLKRRLMYLLDIDVGNGEVYCNGIFEFNAGEATISTICDSLESARTVILDTSSFSGQVELLVGSLIVTEMFNRYKTYKMNDSLNDKPVISIVLEEAPRVLGKEILEKGSNIFSTIAREGRKFKVGLIAITQLPSMIPRDILANMNTKIILGTEMVQERSAIIDSASQDLSTDSRNIASLDKGECIVSSNFAKFALPIKIPLFSEFARMDIQLRLKDKQSGDKEILGLGE